MIKSITNLFGRMFGSQPKHTCCNGCMDVLHMVIDGEASEDQVKYLNEHIEDCAPCYNHYNIDKSVKEVLRHRMQKKDVPQSLIDGIKNNIGKEVH